MRHFLILSSAVVLMLCIGSSKDFSTAPHTTYAPRSMAYMVPPMVQVVTADVIYPTTEERGYPAPATTVAVRPQQPSGQAWRLTHAARSSC